MIIVAVNGQPGSGKSFLCDAVYQALKLNSGKPAVFPVRRSLKQPLRTALVNFVREYIAPALSDSDEDYADAKELDIGGISGRDFMIAMGDAMRAKNPAFLPNLLLDTLVVRYTSSAHVVALVDDVGFAPELARFKADDAAKTISVYCEDWAIKNNPVGQVYAHGEQFVGDSRICLRGDADLIDPPVAVLYDAILAKIAESAP